MSLAVAKAYVLRAIAVEPPYNTRENMNSTVLSHDMTQMFP